MQVRLSIFTTPANAHARSHTDIPDRQNYCRHSGHTMLGKVRLSEINVFTPLKQCVCVWLRGKAGKVTKLLGQVVRISSVHNADSNSNSTEEQ